MSSNIAIIKGIKTYDKRFNLYVNLFFLEWFVNIVEHFSENTLELMKLQYLLNIIFVFYFLRK